MSEDAVEKYYQRVRECLERVGTWKKTLRKFPPGAVKSIIWKIIERFRERYEDPGNFDWCTNFQLLKDYRSASEFIKYLESKGYIPPSREYEIEEYLSELERMASSLGYTLVKTERAREIWSIEKLEDEINKLKKEISSLKKAVEDLVNTLKKTGDTRTAIGVSGGVTVRKPRVEQKVIPIDVFVEKAERELTKPTMDRFFEIVESRLRRYFPYHLIGEIIDKYRSAFQQIYDSSDPAFLLINVDKLVEKIVGYYYANVLKPIPASQLSEFVIFRKPLPRKVYYKDRVIEIKWDPESLKHYLLNYYRQPGRTPIIQEYSPIGIHSDIALYVFYFYKEPEWCFVDKDDKLIGCDTPVVSHWINQRDFIYHVKILYAFPPEAITYAKRQWGEG